MTVELGPAHALLRTLRRSGSETELTQALAAVLEAEPRAAAEFVRAVAASASAPAGEAIDISDLPAELFCLAEQTVEQGRVDLEFFDDARVWHVIIEIKVYARYGRDQISRYLESFRPEASRTLLAAITRDVPTYGDLEAGADPRWLGSVRWAKLLPRLRTLPLTDEGLASQWPLFLEVLEAEGSMGFTQPDPDLFAAWGASVPARNHMIDFLDTLWMPMLDSLRDALAEDGEAVPHESVAGVVTKGQAKKAVHPYLGKVLVRFQVPASGPEWIWAGMWGWEDPRFVVEVAYPTGGGAAARAVTVMRRAGFESWRDRVLSRYLPLDANALARETLNDDVLAFAADSFHVIVRSGLLTLEAHPEAELGAEAVSDET